MPIAFVGLEIREGKYDAVKGRVNDICRGIPEYAVKWYDDLPKGKTADASGGAAQDEGSVLNYNAMIEISGPHEDFISELVHGQIAILEEVKGYDLVFVDTERKEQLESPPGSRDLGAIMERLKELRLKGKKN